MANRSGVSRRSLLGAGAAAALGSVTARPAMANFVAPKEEVKNIIFLCSDGMSTGVPSMLDHYLELTAKRPSFWRTLMNEKGVVNGHQDTRSLSSLVTDSAAASSSWGSGRHVWNGQINVFPNGTELKTLHDLLCGEAGMKMGLVTTATVTHATPAGFVARIQNRDDEHLIAEQYLRAGVDVLMGGGDRFFAKEKRKDGRDLYADFAAAGYTVAKDKAGVAAAPNAKKLLAVFSNGHVPYRVDRDTNPELGGKIPTLAEMSEKALAMLKGAPNGFILQIEAARVDHAAHANDFAGLVHDQREFDDAIRTAVEWARKEGNTLVVVTSDHGNSNPGLNGAGGEYELSTAGLLTLTGMKSSYEVFMPKAMRAGSAADLTDLLAAELGLKLAEKEVAMAFNALKGDWALKDIEQYGIATSAMSIAIQNQTHVGWTGRQHTNDFTMVTATGPGAEAFAGLTQNTSWFDVLLALRGLKHSNPTMTYEEAKKHMDQRKAAGLQAAIKNHWTDYMA